MISVMGGFKLRKLLDTKQTRSMDGGVKEIYTSVVSNFISCCETSVTVEMMSHYTNYTVVAKEDEAVKK